jgi:predicted lysophospholipase L1 biosynthesis ABC-type transport system permease subunit
MAKKYWPKEDPIGARITIARGLGPEFEDATRVIVGVVGSVREGGLSQPPAPVMYVPVGQVSDALTRFGNKLIPASWVIRTEADPMGLAPAVRREIQAVEGQAPIANIRTMERLLRDATARESFNMLLLGIFAGIALLLAAIGIYGLMAYGVEQRSHEIGVRMALGAGRGDVLRMFVWQGLKLALVGVVLGLGAAYGLTRLLAGLLYGVTARDPLTFGAVAVVLSAVALVAGYVPARRATQVDPIVTLRYE